VAEEGPVQELETQGSRDTNHLSASLRCVVRMDSDESVKSEDRLRHTASQSTLRAVRPSRESPPASPFRISKSPDLGGYKAGFPYQDKVDWCKELRHDTSHSPVEKKRTSEPLFALRRTFRADRRRARESSNKMDDIFVGLSPSSMGPPLSMNKPKKQDSFSFTPMSRRSTPSRSQDFRRLTKSAEMKKTPEPDQRDPHAGMWNLPKSTNQDLVVEKEVDRFCRHAQNPTNKTANALWLHSLRDSVNREVRKAPRGEKKSHVLLASHANPDVPATRGIVYLKRESPGPKSF